MKLKDSIQSTLRLRPGEWRIVLPLILLLAINAMAMEIGAVVAVSGFLSNVGTNQIVFVWIVDMVLVIFIASLQSLVIDKVSRKRSMYGIIFGLAAFYLFIRFLFFIGAPDGLNYGLLYLLADQQLLFFPLIFWLLANDNMITAQAKRLFPLIGIGGFLGQILGLLISGTTVSLFERFNISTVELLLFNAAAYIVAVFILRRIKLVRQQASQQVEGLRQTLSEGWGFVKEVASFRYLMLSMIAVGLVLTIIEFYFLVVSGATFTDSNSFQIFYSFYRLSIIILSILMQSLLTSRLIERIGLRSVFLIVPTAMMVSLIGMMALPGIITAAVGRGLSRLPFATIDESGRKAFQGLVPESRRGRVSMFMDSYLYALGTIIGSIILTLIIYISPQFNLGNYFYIYLGVAIAFTVFALWTLIKMRNVYENSLLNWRLKRQRQKRGGVFDKLDF